MIRKKGRCRITVFLLILAMAVSCLPVNATEEEEVLPTGPDWAIDMATAPAVIADSAILMDIDTGVTLYEKNIHKRQYPASVTKLLTCLVAAEHSEMTDIVTFSHEAVFGIERGSSNIGMDEGEQLTMEQCYYGALLASANEVSSGMAEHVGGSIEGFAAMMNEKVKELGGTDSNFVNANGLHDDNHYTSAYDMALIGQAFARNETLLEISGTVVYHIDATPTQPDTFDLRNHHRMLPGCQYSDARPYEYMLGGKNGYTSVAQLTLVTFAKKDGHRLVCVVLKDYKKPNHYVDTEALLDYGFGCYDDPTVMAQIDVKVKELQAARSEENEALEEAEEEPSGEDASKRLTLEEMDERVENAGKQEMAESTQTEADKTADIAGDVKKKAGFPILTVAVFLVVLAAAAVCGYIFYRNYRKEQERRQRRAEIMARHRARREVEY